MNSENSPDFVVLICKWKKDDTRKTTLDWWKTAIKEFGGKATLADLNRN
jgi:hypothetical protein